MSSVLRNHFRRVAGKKITTCLPNPVAATSKTWIVARGLRLASVVCQHYRREMLPAAWVCHRTGSTWLCKE